jgi:D-arginine dehydrogenase
MDTHDTDCIVIGAGIAGASAGAFLAADRRVALIEAEEAAGYHTTGRSAALWILNYGPADVRALTGASRGFFAAPPDGFAEVKLWSARDVLYLAAAGDAAAADERWRAVWGCGGSRWPRRGRWCRRSATGR